MLKLEITWRFSFAWINNWDGVFGSYLSTSTPTHSLTVIHLVYFRFSLKLVSGLVWLFTFKNIYRERERVCVLRWETFTYTGSAKHKSISNRIAFRWKIHFKLKINVLQKHILSFGIDNINSSVKLFLSLSHSLYAKTYKNSFYFCVYKIPAYKLYVHTAILCADVIVEVKFYTKNSSTKIHDKSLVAHPLCERVFICFVHACVCIMYFADEMS